METTMTLSERWFLFQQKEGQQINDDPKFDDFALRADGALVFFDEWGYFLMVSTGEGMAGGERVPNVLMLEGPDGSREEVYCEPIWLSGYYDIISEWFAQKEA